MSCLRLFIVGSLSKYTYFFLFIFWWHQIFSFTFFFSCLVLPTLQRYIHIICSRKNHHDKKSFQDMLHPLISFSMWCYQHKIILCRKINNNFYVKSGYLFSIQEHYSYFRIFSLESYFFSPQYLENTIINLYFLFS